MQFSEVNGYDDDECPANADVNALLPYARGGAHEVPDLLSRHARADGAHRAHANGYEFAVHAHADAHDFHDRAHKFR